MKYICTWWLHEESDDSLPSRTSLSPDELNQLLEFCLTATYLSFQGQSYKQVFGTAMGSPVSVAVANLVMEDVEDRALETFDIQLPFWKRFVDDTCTVVPKERVQDLLIHLNSIEESIQFTCEMESMSPVPGCPHVAPTRWINSNLCVQKGYTH